MGLSSSISLPDYYRSLWSEARPLLTAGQLELDAMLSAPEKDFRRGITLLTRPTGEVPLRVQHFLQEMAGLEPTQYYYPASDLHVTVLSIVSCVEGFTLGSICPEEYAAVVQKALEQLPPFAIRFRGVTASAAGILLQGFPVGKGLEVLRENLRCLFRNSGLLQSIDQRYAIQTAHSTVIRFQEPLRNPAAFLQKLEEYRTADFESFSVRTLELVYNDWYQRQEHTHVLGAFNL